MAIIHNYTPHAISVYSGDVVSCVISPDGIARVIETSSKVDEVNGIDIVLTTYGEVQGLPEPQEGHFYIVSVLTAMAAHRSGRSVDDLLLTSDLVRDDNGRIVGCRRFARYI